MNASAWVRVFAGFYKRIGSDGITVLAEISRDDNGTWSYMVKPFGKASLAWQVTGHRTLIEAKRMAEASYRSYMREHAAMNARSTDQQKGIVVAASYSTVRNYLSKEFPISKTSTGRRSGQRWSEGVQVRTSQTLGVIVDYAESHAEWGSDGSLRNAKLNAVRKHLEQRFTVKDHPARDGRMVVSG